MSIIFISSVLYFCVYIFSQVQCGPFVANIVKKNGVVTLKSNSNAAPQFNSKTYTGFSKDDDSQMDKDENLDPVPDDMSAVDSNNDPEISIGAKEETDSPTVRKTSSTTPQWRIPWAYTPGTAHDMTTVNVYTFSLNRDQGRIDFYGSRELSITAAIVCTYVTLNRHGDFLQITDGLGGQVVYSESRKFTGSRRPSNNGTDLYLRYKGRNPSTICTVRSFTSGLKQIRELPVTRFEVPSVNQQCECAGKLPRTISAKIVGGQDANPFEFPWQAALVYIGTRIGKCGASVINERYAISAAHCFYKLPRNTEILLHAHILDQMQKKQPELHNHPVDVPGRDVEKKTDQDEHSLRLEIEDVSVHPLYIPQQFDYDVALIRFRDTIDFTKYSQIKPICLESWKARTDYSGRKALVSGWGKPHENSTELARLLQKLTIKMYSRESCAEFNKDISFVSPRVICGGNLKGGEDACQGDSGGPLSLNDDDNWLLIGLVSNGEGCARKNLLGLYTSIGETRQWIERMVERDTKWCHN